MISRAAVSVCEQVAYGGFLGGGYRMRATRFPKPDGVKPSGRFCAIFLRANVGSTSKG